ncbi:MAG: hypothetical protein WCP55_01295 [Lentisphaerota bacterium]
MITEAADPMAASKFANAVKGVGDIKSIETAFRSHTDPLERKAIIDHFKGLMDKAPYGKLNITLEAGMPTGENNKIKRINFTVSNCVDDEERKAVGSLLSSIFNSFNKEEAFSRTGASIDQSYINELARSPVKDSAYVVVRDNRTTTLSSRSTGNLFQRRLEALGRLNGVNRFKDWWNKAVMRGGTPDAATIKALNEVKFDVIPNNIRYVYVDFNSLINDASAGRTVDEMEGLIDLSLAEANKDLDSARDELGLNEKDELPDMKLYRTPAGHEAPLTTVRTGYKYVVVVDWKQVK